MEKKFGDAKNPLLVSVRSGARASMPGMMETILNVGLAPSTIPGLIARTNNPRFVYDAYRRLIMMYSDVVMEKAAGIEPEGEKGIRKQLEGIMHEMKARKGAKQDTDLSADDLKELSEQFKARVAAGPRQAVPGRADGPVVGQHQRRVPELERPPRGRVPPHREDPGRVGHRRHRPDDGVRQHRRHLRHRRGLHARPGHRPQYLLRRVAAERAGRGRRRRNPHPPAGQRGREDRAHEEPDQPRKGHARGLQAAQRDPAETGEALPRHARHRVHDRGRPPVHAPVPRRQAQRRGGGEDRRGHGQREVDQAGRGGDAHQAGRAGAVPAADGGPGRGARGQTPRERAARRSRRRRRHGGLHRRRGSAPRRNSARW